MADKWDELTQLEEAYRCLRTQPRDAQLRMMAWLHARLDADHEEAMKARAEAARQRSTVGDEHG